MLIEGLQVRGRVSRERGSEAQPHCCLLSGVLKQKMQSGGLHNPDKAQVKSRFFLCQIQSQRGVVVTCEQCDRRAETVSGTQRARRDRDCDCDSGLGQKKEKEARAVGCLDERNRSEPKI